MEVVDLGQMPYRDAWALQQRLHEEVVAGAPEKLLFVEHPPVVTLGRRPDVVKNLIATPDQLTARGVELVETDRGGDVTFHGPGQIVVYPIVRLIDHRLSIGGYVHRLEDAIVAALEPLGLSAGRDACAVGVWVERRDPPAGHPKTAKIAAIGVRIRKGVTMHGLALNVSTDLSYFDLIVPCGLKDRAVTSVSQELGKAVGMDDVKPHLTTALLTAFSENPPKPAAKLAVAGVCEIGDR